MSQFRELKGYGYLKRGNEVVCENPSCIAYLYRFKTNKNNTYIVRVEHFKHDVFILKFYCKKHKDSKFKYVMLTNYFDDPRLIIETCIKIGLELYKKHPYASFGFIGSPDLKELVKADDQILLFTRRFRLYKRFAVNYFNYENFFHLENINYSAYLLLNRAAVVKDNELLNKVSTMFAEQYDIQEVFLGLKKLYLNSK